MTESPDKQYDRASVLFHWASAAVILTMWPIGKLMVRHDGEPSQLLYSTHVVLGLSVALVTLGRVIWVFRRQPPEDLDMPRWERLLFAANHYALYGLLLLLAASGIAILLAAGGFDALALAKNDGPREQHEIGSTVFLLLFLMHVAGVVYYQVKKGRTLRRMGVPLG